MKKFESSILIEIHVLNLGMPYITKVIQKIIYHLMSDLICHTHTHILLVDPFQKVLNFIFYKYVSEFKFCC